MKKLILFVCLSTSFAYSQSKQYNIKTVAFYNLENLFDTINDITKDDEKSPIMELKGHRSKVYWDKIDKLGTVISQIGKDRTHTSPVIIGVAEVENRTVLEDLVKSEHLKDKNYRIIHYDSPDKRGIDVALLYQQNYFSPIHHEVFDPNIYIDNRKIATRDQLLVSGYLDSELIHLIVNHWPSRRGGETKSNPLREKAAYQNVKIMAKIRENDENAKIIVMGDFNDNPTNTSFKTVLKTKNSREKVTKNDVYNPYEKMFRNGFNTLGHRDAIHLFDQLLLTAPLVNNTNFSSYTLFKAGIFNHPFLTQRKGKHKGYPFRSFENGQYTGGYSDHYPVYVYLIKKVKQY